MWLLALSGRARVPLTVQRFQAEIHAWVSEAAVEEGIVQEHGDPGHIATFEGIGKVDNSDDKLLQWSLCY